MATKSMQTLRINDSETISMTVNKLHHAYHTIPGKSYDFEIIQCNQSKNLQNRNSLKTPAIAQQFL